MSILQISRITHRKGLYEDLPQLAAAELGWAADQRRLFIGNGSLEDGAPVIGNTEILTEFSQLLDGGTFVYSYNNSAATARTGYSASNTVDRSMQQRFDERVSVLEYGAVGKGNTDDTAAINNALFDLYGRLDSLAVGLPEEIAYRRLYFPPGVYVVSGRLSIPPNAFLEGDGKGSTVIVYRTNVTDVGVGSVFRFVDSQMQSDADLGTNDANLPGNIYIRGMDIVSESANVTPIVIGGVDNATFDNVSAIGAGSSACVSVIDENGISPTNVTLEKMYISGAVRGVDVSAKLISGRIVSSEFENLTQGVVLGNDVSAGEETTPTGISITHNNFDSIHSQGILTQGDTKGNMTGFNRFRDVGNNNGATPVTHVVEFTDDGNVSLGDIFDRTDSEDRQVRRIGFGNPANIAFDSSHAFKMGAYIREVGLRSTVAASSLATLFTVYNSVANAFGVDYTVTIDGIGITSGYIKVVNDGTAVMIDHDEVNSIDGNYVTAVATGSNTEIKYNNASGTDAVFSYSVTKLEL